MQQVDYFRMVDAVDNPATIQYAYAPSIIFQDNVYHVFFCSGGNISPAWDYIRYTKSEDGGQTWSVPVDMLHATAYGGMDLSACDPSVVYFQGFYYMYYGSAVTNATNVYQTVVQIARSTAIDGPYLTYTQRGTWEDTPTDPQVIIQPLVTRTEQPSGYGAGQPSAVVVNGKIRLWYSDDSLMPGASGDWGSYRLYLLESSDPVTWTPDKNRVTNIYGEDSPDVKYEPNTQMYIATWIQNMFTNGASLVRASSTDGLTFGKTQVLIYGIPDGSFPPFSNNVGDTSDSSGNLIPSAAQRIIGFGKPLSQNAIDAGHWDMDGFFENQLPQDGL